MAAGVVAGVALCTLGFCLAVLFALDSGMPVEEAPGKWRLQGVEPVKLMAVARELMRNSETNSYYWNSDQGPTPYFEAPERTWAIAVEATRVDWFGYVDSRLRVRSVQELPEPLKSMRPATVAICRHGIVMTWDGHEQEYFYGYGLILLPESANASWLRATDRSYRRNVELREGIWSYYLFH